MKRRLLSLAICLVVALTSLIVSAGSEDFSPWEAWREGFSFFEKGGREKEKGNRATALQLYKQARDRYLSVRNARPEWNQKIIGNRIQMCDSEIAALEKLAETSRGFPSSSGPAATRRDSEESTALREELAKYKKKLFVALVEIDDQRRSLQRANANVRQTEDLMREKRVIEEKLRTLQQQYNQLENKLSQPDAERGRLENRLVEEKMKADLLARKMKMMQDQKDEQRRELAELYRSRTALEIKEKEYKARIQKLERDNITLEKHGATVQEQQRELQDKITRLNSRDQQRLDNAKIYKQEIAKLNQWVDELRKEGGDQSRLTQEAFDENKQLNKRQSELLEENQRFKEQIEILQNNLRASNINTVQITNTLARINEQKGLLEQQYKLLQEDFRQIKNSAENNQGELDNLRKQNRRLENDLKTFAEKYEIAKKRLADRSASEYQNILTLNRRNQQLTEDLTQQNINLEKLQSTLEATEKNRQILELQLTKSQNENRQLSANQKIMELEKDKIKNIEQDLKRQQEINSRLQSQLNQAAPLAAKYQKTLKQLAELTNLKDDYLRLQQTNQELSDKNRRLQLAVADMERLRQDQVAVKQQLLELESLRKANRELTENYRNNLDKNDLLTEKNRSLSEKINTLSTRITNLDKVRYEYEKVQGEKKRLTDIVAQQTRQLDELREKFRDTASIAADNFKKYEKKAQEVLELVSKQKNLAARNQELKAAATRSRELQEQLTGSEKRYQELQQELQTLQQDTTQRLAVASAEAKKLKEEQRLTAKVRQQHQSAQREVAVLKQQLAELQQIKTRHDQLQQTVLELEEHQKTLAAKNRELDGVAARNQELQKQLAELRQIKTRHDQLQQTVLELEGHRKTLVERNQELAKAVTHNHELQEQLTESEKRNRELQISGQNTARQLAAVTTEAQRHKEDRETLHAELTKMRSEAIKSAKEVLKLPVAEQQLEAYKSSIRQQEALTKKLEEEQQLVAEVRRQYQTAQQDIAGLKQQHSTLQEQLTELRQVKTRNEQLQQTLLGLERSKKALATENQELDGIAARNQELQKQLAELRQVKTRHDQLRQTVLELEKQQKTLAAKNRELDGVAARNQELQKQLAELRQVKTRHDQLQQTVLELEEHQKTLVAKNRELDGVAARNQELQEQLTEREKQYQTLLGRLEDTENTGKKLAALSETVAVISEERDSLRNEITRLREQSDADAAALRERIRSLSDVHVQREALHKELLAINSRFQEAAEKQQEEGRKLSELSGQKVADQARLKVYEDRISSFEKQVGDDAATIQQLRIDNTRLARSTGEMEDKIKQLDNQLAALQSSSDVVTRILHRPEALSEERLAQLLQDGAKAEKREADDVAIWNYRQIIDAMPKNVTAHHRLGAIMLRRGQNEEAVDLLQKAYIINPDDADIAINYAKSLIALDRAGNALAVLRKVYKGKELKNSELNLVLGRVLFETGQIDEAREQLERVVKLSPDKPGGYLWQARLLAADKNNLDSAAGYYRQARKLGASPDPSLEKALAAHLSDNADMIDFMSKAALEAEKSADWTSAVWYYTQLGQISPGNQLFSNKLAMSYLLQNQPEKALEEVVTDNNPPGAMIAAVAAAMQQDASLALKFLKLARQHQQSLPDWVKPLCVIGKQHLSKTSKLTPDAGEALQILKQLGQP